MRIVMLAPQPWEGRDRHNQAAARNQLFPKPGKTFHVFFDMLDDVERNHDVECPGRKGNLVGKHSGLDVDRHFPPGNFSRLVIKFKGFKVSKAGQHTKISAGAAACFQNTEVAALRREALNYCLENLAAREEPPMLAFKLVEPVIDAAFHESVPSF